MLIAIASAGAVGFTVEAKVFGNSIRISLK